MNRPLQVGDLCVTVNTNQPACNDGVLVVIHKIDHCQQDKKGTSTPYCIRRVDGLPHVSTLDKISGKQRWFIHHNAWCTGYKLQRIEPGEPVENAEALAVSL